MSEREDAYELMVEQAAGICAGSQNMVGTTQAMELVGFSKEERTVAKLYQRVRRRASKLEVVAKESTEAVVPTAVDVCAVDSSLSSLTSSSRTTRTIPDENPMTTAEVLLETAITSTSKEKEAKAKAYRRTTRELQRVNATTALAKSREKQAMKVATTIIKKNLELSRNDPMKKSIAVIVKDINKRFKSNISKQTAARYVRAGLIGMSPLKKGPVGDFPKRIYASLKGAFATYLKLEQAGSTKQSSTKQMSKLVNATVNKAGFCRKRDDLTRKLQKDTADQFERGKANVVEQRRVMWTTAYNLDVWFSTWKDTLIDLGFARDKTLEDGNVEGELVFFPGQLERIGNVDETDGSIDDTTGQRGGRPPMRFFASDVVGGATAVNKNSFSSTIICGSNAAGDPFPPHFQLKTAAQTDEGQRLSVDWFVNCKDVVGKFGHPSRISLPCTFGMNDRGGMNSVELEKYMRGSILPLYPDIADVPLKRVIMKVDSGPGRMNVEMLANMRLQGLYLVPGVPNTTSQTQETDQNYGPFKGKYRGNIRTLSQARFDQKMVLRVTDLPLLVFGGSCPSTGVELEDAFSCAFGLQSNLSCWRKCGAVPLTRLPLQSKEVRREVPVGAAATHSSAKDDPEIENLKNIESLNSFYCQNLSANGYDGAQLSIKAPTRKTYVAVTKPHSQARVQAIKKAKTAGQMFYATGGKHLNSDEFFKASELKRRTEAIKEMEEKKIQRAKYCKEQRSAVLLLKSKGELTHGTEKEFTIPEVKTLLKWKKVKLLPTKKAARKKDLVDAYVDAPKPKIQKVWTRGEEKALVVLKMEDLPLIDTALGVATQQMSRAVGNNLAQLNEESMAALKTAIGIHDENTGPNIL